MLKKYPLMLCLGWGLLACTLPVEAPAPSATVQPSGPAPTPSAPALPTASPTSVPTPEPVLNLAPSPTPAATPTPAPVATVMPSGVPTPNPTPTPTPLPEPTASAIVWGEEGVLFSNFNDQPVQNSPIALTHFTLAQPAQLTYLETYHWNDGQGAPPGTLALLDRTGRYYGPWPVRTRADQPGQLNTYWYVNLNLELPPGTYTVLDSDAQTWAYNAGTRSQGMLRVRGRLPAGAADAPAP